jgi:hypothetical protein
VAAPVRVERLDQADAVDLAQALAVRGLVGRLTEVAGGVALEIRDDREDPSRLIAEVLGAVRAWLADRQHAPLVVFAGDVRRMVGPESELPAALAARVWQSRRSS